MERNTLLALMAVAALTGVGVFYFTQAGETVGMIVLEESMLQNVHSYSAGQFTINLTNTGYNIIGDDTNPYTWAHYILTVTNGGTAKNFTFSKSNVVFTNNISLEDFQVHQVIEKDRFPYNETIENETTTKYRWVYAWANETPMNLTKTIAVSSGTTEYVVILKVPRWSSGSYEMGVDTPFGRVTLE